MHTTQVLLFQFDARVIRTLLIDEQPWFVASDVSSALKYRIAGDMTRNLDDDEKGTQIVRTPGGDQEMLVINESGLYTAILRSRKTEAKRFKRWVTAEILPAIRKYGFYAVSPSKSLASVDQTIGATGFNCLAAVLDGKLRNLKGGAKRAAKNHLWQQVHRAFCVIRAKDIPSSQLDAARNFIASYNVYEGEWISNKVPIALPRLNVDYPLEFLTIRRPDMLITRQPYGHYLDLTLKDLCPYSSPCELVLAELARNGYNVDAAWWEVRTYRTEVERLLSAISALQKESASPQRYAI
ncbi:BRO family protein [Ectopseudomonas mendocina]|uniref:BRO family protein n=1 Tax=Ectopseudomonas mendocina TaxID=300 RepID=A0ABZ2RNE5_ECTME